MYFCHFSDLGQSVALQSALSSTKDRSVAFSLWECGVAMQSAGHFASFGSPAP
jgi:hypothetical protein